MKSVFLSVLAGLLAAGVVRGAEPAVEVGRVMCVGDSITHGSFAPSYRWPLHKIFVDNGVKFEFVGVNVGNQPQKYGVTPGIVYAGVPFNNRHSAICSERAFEIAGRRNKSGRLGNSNIFDWLGLDKTYKGKYTIDPQTQMPDVFILMIGTNDTYSDYGDRGGIGAKNYYKTVLRNLLGPGGDMDTIVGAMRKAAPGARILLLTIPTWHDGTRHTNRKEDYAVIMDYNEKLKTWAAGKGIEVLDVNRYLVDIARTDKPGVGEEQFFNSRDHLHPTAQGDMLIAADIAQRLGVGGRTVGLPRKATSDFELSSDEKAEIFEESWLRLPAEKGVTLVLQGAAVGNGATDGWDSEKGLYLFMCRNDEARFCASLQMTESAILWNNHTVLYRSDMSKNTEEVRIAWVPKPEGENRKPGFYVWLGDRLIGEALPGIPDEALCWVPSASVGASSELPCKTGVLRVESGAWAPAQQ